ncbi:hypothetical protein HID58_017916 [Brassica napus]|uniref:Uncharacterized protein n=1 Tax=Brassica napus TaxID=3708 RepID=A0ABQ8DB04_BRANA|nr:hypothetical protein HID58_017916 [Brassica napus]
MSTQRCQGYKCSFQWSFHWYLQALELLDGGSDYLGKGVSKAVGDEQKKTLVIVNKLVEDSRRDIEKAVENEEELRHLKTRVLVATSRQLEGKVEVQKLMEENVNNAKSWL